MSQWNDALNLLKSFGSSDLSKATDSTAASWAAAREGSKKMEEEEADKKPGMLQRIWDRKTGQSGTGKWVSRTPSTSSTSSSTKPPTPPQLSGTKGTAIEGARKKTFQPLTARPGAGPFGSN
jgi:hypothetical protein